MHNNILRLNVSMDDSFSMNVLEPNANLSDDISGFCVLESVLLLQHREEMTIHAELLKQIDTFAIREEPIQIYYILMPQVELDLNLPDQLLFDLLLPYH